MPQDVLLCLQPQAFSGELYELLYQKNSIVCSKHPASPCLLIQAKKRGGEGLLRVGLAYTLMHVTSHVTLQIPCVHAVA